MAASTTSADIATTSGCGKRLAMRATYCLQRAGATRTTGRRGRLKTYEAVFDGTCQ